MPERCCEEVAKLYLLQVQAVVMQGIHNHLLEVEMPWIVTNAAMERNGVLVSREQCMKVLNGTKAKLGPVEVPNLKSMALSKP